MLIYVHLIGEIFLTVDGYNMEECLAYTTAKLTQILNLCFGNILNNVLPAGIGGTCIRVLVTVNHIRFKSFDDMITEVLVS